jgi:transcriptional regulator of nitric oxide reductase
VTAEAQVTRSGTDNDGMTPNSPEPIVRAMLAAVHRRDHAHAEAGPCHPHSVEVVHLGTASIAVCHDCVFESGFHTVRECERAATDHRLATAS